MLSMTNVASKTNYLTKRRFEARTQCKKTFLVKVFSWFTRMLFFLLPRSNLCIRVNPLKLLDLNKISKLCLLPENIKKYLFWILGHYKVKFSKYVLPTMALFYWFFSHSHDPYSFIWSILSSIGCRQMRVASHNPVWVSKQCLDWCQKNTTIGVCISVYLRKI